MDHSLQMLRELVEAPGVPGFEDGARLVMARYLEPVARVSTDHLGSVIGEKRGGSDRPRVMLAGHLDEVGFMVTHVSDQGFLSFQTLGGWWEQVMLAHRVEVHGEKGPVIGVVGSKPPHILTADERKQVVQRKDMFIDVGARSRQEAEAMGIRPGDPVVPWSPFTPMADARMLLAKAWDNRVGCALAVDVVRELAGGDHPNTVYAVGTVQEEVGLRGAATTSFAVEPDIGIALESTIAGDTPGVKPQEARGVLGGGPALLLYDRSMIPHVGLRRLVMDTAAAEGIPLQTDAMAAGGTDAGRMHIFGRGVPSVVIGVPVRYIHTHSGILCRDDFDQAVQLVAAVVRRLDAATVEGLRDYR